MIKVSCIMMVSVAVWFYDIIGHTTPFEEDPLTVAVIGAGPTGVYAVHHLLQHSRFVDITIFESDPTAGKGMPYHEAWIDRSMLANIESKIVPPLVQTLNEWIERLPDKQLRELGIIDRKDINDFTFLPRTVVGEYFCAQLAHLQDKAARQGSRVTIKSGHHVNDIETSSEGMIITYTPQSQTSQKEIFHYALMTTGHAWAKNAPDRCCFFSPWPISDLHAIEDCHIGILGTSLSAIDALLYLAQARGAFVYNEEGILVYEPRSGTQAFQVTLMSRKGCLPEAGFYWSLKYKPPTLCTEERIQALIQMKCPDLLDRFFALIKSEIIEHVPDKAQTLGLENLTLEAFHEAYFAERLEKGAIIHAQQNLEEVLANHKHHRISPWHETMLSLGMFALFPMSYHLHAQDNMRYVTYLKPVFDDVFSVVPHASIERILALHRVNKLDILPLGAAYTLDMTYRAGGALLTYKDQKVHFPAFINATGQPVLSRADFPFPSLERQGIIHNATAPLAGELSKEGACREIGGIAVNATFNPITATGGATEGRFFCLSLPFLWGQFPFLYGLDASNYVGEVVAGTIFSRRFDGSHGSATSPANEI